MLLKRSFKLYENRRVPFYVDFYATFTYSKTLKIIFCDFCGSLFSTSAKIKPAHYEPASKSKKSIVKK